MYKNETLNGDVISFINNKLCCIVVSSLRQIIKPGYGLAPRSHTFSSATTTGSTHIGVPVSFRHVFHF